MLFLAAALTWFTTAAWSDEPALPLDALFVPPGNFGIADGYSVAIGDFNHDGRSDVAVADRFGKLHTFERIASSPRSLVRSWRNTVRWNAATLVVADMNNDGRRSGGRKRRWNRHALQNASGTLEAPGHVVGSVPADFLCVSDFDGDGRQDIAAMGNGQLNLYLQKPGGGLNEPVQTPLAGLVWDCKVSDVNGDGRDDLVILPYSLRETIVLIALQKETGGFEDIRTLTWEGIQGPWDATQAATALRLAISTETVGSTSPFGPLGLNLLFQHEDGLLRSLQIGEGWSFRSGDQPQ